ncbi:hypothetical protein ACU8KH_05211 [Lachancea thermotolerans]
MFNFQLCRQPTKKQDVPLSTGSFQMLYKASAHDSKIAVAALSNSFKNAEFQLLLSFTLCQTP